MRDDVDDSHIPPALGHWGQRVGSLAYVPALLCELGASPQRVLASVGLTPRMLSDPEQRIDYAAFGLLMKHGAEMTGHPEFGLRVGSLWNLDSLGVVGEVMRNCATLGEATQMLVVHQQINSAGGLTFLLTRAAIADFGHAIYYPGVSGVNQIVDACLAAGFNYVRELVGPTWRPTEVFLQHAKPADPKPYARLFGVMPRFNSEFSALRFPAYWLDRPVRGADRARKLDALARARAMSPGFLVQAYRGLRTLLLHGRYSGDDLAQLLAMHRRTLNRRLRDEGTTFQAVMDSVRFEVARQLLAYTDVGMDDIAASLGYASVSPFMRSFKRWSGMSPGQCRRRTLTQRRHDPSPSTQLAHVTSAHGLASTAPTGRVISSNRRPRDAEAGAF